MQTDDPQIATEEDAGGDVVAVGQRCFVGVFEWPRIDSGFLTSCDRPGSYIKVSDLPWNYASGSCPVYAVPKWGHAFRTEAALARWLIQQARDVIAVYEEWLEKGGEFPTARRDGEQDGH